MPNVCKTCRHPERDRIDGLLLKGDPAYALAQRFGLNVNSVARHKKKHLTADVRRSLELRSLKRANGIAARVEEYLLKAETLTNTAHGAGELREAVAALRTAHDILRTQGELTGELGRAGAINITLGVPMDVARRRLEVVDQARALPAGDIVERALSVLERTGLTAGQAERAAQLVARASREASGAEVVGADEDA